MFHVHDHILLLLKLIRYMYWRLLSTDPKVTRNIVLGQKPKITDDTNRLPVQMLERLVGNVGSLSSVYRQLPEAFLARR